MRHVRVAVRVMYASRNLYLVELLITREAEGGGVLSHNAARTRHVRVTYASHTRRVTRRVTQRALLILI